MLNAASLRHEKEQVYLALCIITSILCWLVLIWFAWPILLFLPLISWLAGQYFKAVIYGNGIRVTPRQLPEIHQLALEQARELNLTHVPEVFILGGQGAVNAIALRFLTGKYIILYGELVDLMLRRGAYDELKMVIGHELAHHALGHISFIKNILILPARMIPFLGAAYGRACELSADRVGMMLTRNPDAAPRALLAIAAGSESTASRINPHLFAEQEKHVPPIMGFLHEIYSSHPRMTLRINELTTYLSRVSFYVPAMSTPSALKEDSYKQIAASSALTCPACSRSVPSEARFCPGCGHNLVSS